jgi:ribosomal protein S18 acetylase RimI-like enzyme
VVVADGRIVAGALNDVDGDESWVTTLAVLREWRQKGLGMALLRHSFRDFYRRGRTTVLLTVDAENLTGATRLYERAGMSVERQYDRYEKPLDLEDAG